MAGCGWEGGVEKGLGRPHVAKLHHGKAHGWCVAGAEEGQSKIDIKPFFSTPHPVLDQSAPDALVCLELREWNGLLLFVHLLFPWNL
ncbi:hypothetical protein CEXT_192681 [Caerostris extrusa]|uniref:Uncharacterized protein n=1 Tax=Caerostris extrusa TaxID=172846 RepID=A0AAV4T0X3_CAEEX|nr:hypothetical protein CEXT_192681 [Caerostris extrusa]